ncbi:hypothetical protein [Salmonella phage SD-12_S18]|nr:hypothetical protein [Salmonella phage SD-12_S18]
MTSENFSVRLMNDVAYLIVVVMCALVITLGLRK